MPTAVTPPGKWMRKASVIQVSWDAVVLKSSWKRPLRIAGTVRPNWAAKMPVVMASCCSEARRPRICRGEISEM